MGTLRIKALPEAVALRAGVLPYQETRAGLRRTLPKANGEVLCTGSRSKPLQFTLTTDSELLHVTYNPDGHKFVVDGKEIALEPSDLPSLHAYIDGSVIELILSERIGYTKRFYYPGVIAPDITVLVSSTSDTKLTAWKISPISKDRLTTPKLSI